MNYYDRTLNDSQLIFIFIYCWVDKKMSININIKAVEFSLLNSYRFISKLWNWTTWNRIWPEKAWKRGHRFFIALENIIHRWMQTCVDTFMYKRWKSKKYCRLEYTVYIASLLSEFKTWVNVVTPGTGKWVWRFPTTVSSLHPFLSDIH